MKVISKFLSKKHEIVARLEKIKRYHSAVYGDLAFPIDVFVEKATKEDKIERRKVKNVAPVKVKPFVAVNLRVDGLVYSELRSFRMVKVEGYYLREGDVMAFGKPLIILEVLEIEESGFWALITGEGVKKRVWLKPGINTVYF